MIDIRRLFRSLLPAAILFSAVLLSAAARGDDGDYQLGQGYNWGSYNFAGYSDIVEYLPTQGGENQTVGNFSVFVSGHVSSYYNPFIELRISGDGVARANTDISRPGVDPSLSPQRLYDDIEMSDSLTLRVGNMLTPVGAWNQLPVPALALTTARPAVTDLNFSNYLAGMSLNYSDANSDLPDLQVYWQPVGDFDSQSSGGVLNAYQTAHYKMVEGLHASIPLSLLNYVGVSFQRSRNALDTDQTLYGLDFKYAFDALTLQGEFTYSDLSGKLEGVPRHQETGVYLGASYELSERWALTSWVEEYRGRDASSAARDLLWGAVYRPLPAMSFKLEYLQNIGGPPVNPTGLLGSWSVLF